MESHLINEQTGNFATFYKKRKTLRILFGQATPMTLCGLTKETMPKGDCLTTTDNCKCELCLQVNDNIEGPDI